VLARARQMVRVWEDSALIYLLRVLRWQAFPNLTLDNIAQLARRSRFPP
jgi:hypothetical protein